MAVLAATFTTSIVFFPVTFFSGISKYIFTPLALGVVLSIFASYFFAMTVVPLYCANFIRLRDEDRESRSESRRSFFTRFEQKLQREVSSACWTGTRALPSARCSGPALPRRRFWAAWRLCSLVTLPFPGARLLSPHRSRPVRHRRAHAQRHAPGGQQRLHRQGRRRLFAAWSSRPDLDMIVSNIGVYPDLSAIYTTNASMDTAFVQTSLKEDHSIGSYEYMQRVREKLSREMPELTTYFQAGGLVDGVINQGLPAPIDIQVSSMDMNGAYALAKTLAQKIKAMPNVSGVYIPQDLGLPRNCAEHRPREGQPDRSLRQGRGGQRDYRHDLRRHGRPQLLDRSQERQQLHGDGPVREPLSQQHVDGGLREYSPARRSARRLQPDAAGPRATTNDAREFLERRPHCRIYAARVRLRISS